MIPTLTITAFLASAVIAGLILRQIEERDA